MERIVQVVARQVKSGESRTLLAVRAGEEMATVEVVIRWQGEPEPNSGAQQLVRFPRLRAEQGRSHA